MGQRRLRGLGGWWWRCRRHRSKGSLLRRLRRLYRLHEELWRRMWLEMRVRVRAMGVHKLRSHMVDLRLHVHLVLWLRM